MAICIFPGTFNPIHSGHIKMAEFALEKFGFEKIIFIPSYIPPHKDINKNLAKHRYNMVKLAISGNKKFDISDVEYKSEGKSYSLITVEKIKSEYNISGKISFIIGSDAFGQIKTWFKTSELSKNVHFIVFPREGYEIYPAEFLDYSYEIVDMPMINLSSTELRANRGHGAENRVEEYIKANGLYD